MNTSSRSLKTRQVKIKAEHEQQDQEDWKKEHQGKTQAIG
jgi:hypothetical protein